MFESRMIISRNRLQLFTRGHAGYAERGSDIVCAAASTLVNTLLISLRMQMGIGTDVYFDADPPTGRVHLDCGPTEEDAEKARTIFRVVATGLDALAYKYPDNVTFELEET